MEQWYLDNLVCPVDKSPLEYKDGELISPSGRKYPVVEGVPVMLVDNIEQTMSLVTASLESAKNNPDIIPSLENYKKALQAFNGKGKGVGRILRQKYYNQSAGGTKPRCFAGIASAHVNYNGDLWACCVKCETLGNLLENRFRDLWKGKNAMNIRKRIKEEKCSCDMANASYSNTMCSPLSILK